MADRAPTSSGHDQPEHLSAAPAASSTTQRPFADPDQDPAVRLHTLQSAAGLAARVTNHGATLVGLDVPDADGVAADVVLGFDSIDGYRSPANPYFGATIGRVANRIAHGRLSIGGEEFRLAANEPPHHLHGGQARSFDKVLWDVVEADGRQVTLRYRSPHGEEGYPGDVEVVATYRLIGRELQVTYVATTNRTTPLNMTNHAYFNLGGAGSGDILDHEVCIDADRVTTVDERLIPTGGVTHVLGTALDFRGPWRVGERIESLADVAGAHGYDHNFVLGHGPGDRGGGDAACACHVHTEPATSTTPRAVAVVRHPPSGRFLELATNQPCLQFYSGNGLDGVDGKLGARYERHAGLCLEPQHAPDSVNQPQWPPILLEPGATYHHKTIYRFSVAEEPTSPCDSPR